MVPPASNITTAAVAVTRAAAMKTTLLAANVKAAMKATMKTTTKATMKATTIVTITMPEVILLLFEIYQIPEKEQPITFHFPMAASLAFIGI